MSPFFQERKLQLREVESLAPNHMPGSMRAEPHTRGTQTRVPAARPYYLLPSTHPTPATGKAAIYGSLSLNKTSFFYVSEINFRPPDCEKDLHTKAASKLPHLCHGKKSFKCKGNPVCGFGRPVVRSPGGHGSAIQLPVQGGSPQAGPGPLPAGFPSPGG